MGNLLTVTRAKLAPAAPAVVFITSDADPRSPTTAFRRTPLRALRRTAPDLNDPRSPMCNRTPLRCAAAHDPREPTAGLVRTPVPTTTSVTGDVVDPREPTAGLVRTPVPKPRAVRRRLVLDDAPLLLSAPSTPFADCASEIGDEDDEDTLDTFVDVDLDDDVVIEPECESESADAPTTSLLFRSPAIKSASLRFSQIQSKFAARTPSSLRKVMARSAQPAPHDSPHAVRLVDSCPSSPVAA